MLREKILLSQIDGREDCTYTCITTLPLQEHSVATSLGRKNRPRGGFFISGFALSGRSAVG
ncbi:hypothetical protein BZG10_13930 [Salinivibrio kushneri]|nr:hypothetical protein BZG10_13930 [Salinivibrio kushneri]